MNALLIIDVQNDYFPGGAWPQFAAAAVGVRIAAAIRAAEVAGWCIIAVQHINDADAPLLAAGSRGTAWHASVADLLSDKPLVSKRFADAFWQTDLSARLQAAGVREVFLCGLMTQNCITHTALSPDAAAYGMHILADVCSAPDEVIHRIALKALTARLDVSPLDRVLGC